MGVECIEPASEREQATAALMEAFAAFVLEEQPRRSLAMLEENRDGSVGELQGGGEHAIYRVEITDDDEGVVSRLLRAHGHGLTVERIRRHMLRRGIERLENFMLVLAFGPTSGQIRHIDAMVPNRQLCCYMSRDCPSTVVYAPDGPAVDSGAALVASTSAAVAGAAAGATAPEASVALSAAPKSKRKLLIAALLGRWMTHSQRCKSLVGFRR